MKKEWFEVMVTGAKSVEYWEAKTHYHSQLCVGHVADQKAKKPMKDWEKIQFKNAPFREGHGSSRPSFCAKIEAIELQKTTRVF